MLKKIKIFIIVALCFYFVGCKEYGEKRIVNFITIDSNKIAVYYYDFSKKEPVYIKEDKENNGIKNTLVQLLSEAEYDLKLCRYAVVSHDVIYNNMGELFYALTDSRFAPDIIVIEGETNLSAEEYEKLNKNAYPLYNYKTENNMLSCVVEHINGNDKNVIINNELYKQLNEQQSFVFDILSKVIKCGTYIFEYNDKMLSADLEKINVYYFVKNDVLHVNVTAVLKSYKGSSSSEKSKREVEHFVEQSISKNVEGLLSDKTITEEFNLLWYDKVEKFNRIEVNTNIL